MSIYVSDNLIIESFVKALKKGDTDSGLFVISFEAANRLLKDLESLSSEIWGFGIMSGVLISSYYKDIKHGVCFKVIETNKSKSIKFLKPEYETILKAGE